jgi:hypothetical protein
MRDPSAQRFVSAASPLPGAGDFALRFQPPRSLTRGLKSLMASDVNTVKPDAMQRLDWKHMAQHLARLRS